MNSTSNDSVDRGQGPSQLRWETLRPIIQYLNSRMSLKSLMLVMEQDYSLKATKEQYKSQFVKWGLSKKTKSRKTLHVQSRSPPSTPIRSTALPHEQVSGLSSRKSQETSQTSEQERNTRRKLQPSISELLESPGLPLHDQLELPPISQTREVLMTPQVRDEHSLSLKDHESAQPTLSRHHFLGLQRRERWSILHQALLLGVIRGKMLPSLYPTEAAMFTDQFLGSDLSFPLTKVFEALTFIEQQQCGLEELLLTAYLITINAMTPSTSTADATWAKVGFLAFGKACSVLSEFQSTQFRDKQAAEFACTVESEQFSDDAWSCKYVSLLTDQDIARYDVNEWEGTMHQVIENLMHFATCNPDWRSIKMQTRLQMQEKRAQSDTVDSNEA